MPSIKTYTADGQRRETRLRKTLPLLKRTSLFHPAASILVREVRALKRPHKTSEGLFTVSDSQERSSVSGRGQIAPPSPQKLNGSLLEARTKRWHWGLVLSPTIGMVCPFSGPLHRRHGTWPCPSSAPCRGEAETIGGV